MTKNRINISSFHKKQIAKEFRTSLQTVQMSLDYVFNSDKAEKIRARAKELLTEEADKIESNS